MFDLASLQQMFMHAWPVITTLALCSVVSGAIILERWVSLKKAQFDRDQLSARMRKLLLDNKREQAIAHCEAMKKPVGRVLATVLEDATHQRQPSRGELERLSTRMIRAEASEMARYTTGLGTIGSIAPYIGLFGTTIGIIRAFYAMGQSQSGGFSVVALGISEALITTAFGLFVAIPAVVGYNMLTRKIELITESMELCSDEVVDLSAPRGS